MIRTLKVVLYETRAIKNRNEQRSSNYNWDAIWSRDLMRVVYCMWSFLWSFWKTEDTVAEQR